jgi:hypothetical protein
MSGSLDNDVFGGCACDTCSYRATFLKRIHDVLGDVKKDVEAVNPESHESGMVRDLPSVIQCIMDLIENYVNVSDPECSDRSFGAVSMLSRKLTRMVQLTTTTRALGAAIQRMFTGAMPVAMIRQVAGVGFEDDDDGDDGEGGGFNFPPFGKPPGGVH